MTGRAFAARIARVGRRAALAIIVAGSGVACGRPGSDVPPDEHTAITSVVSLSVRDARAIGIVSVMANGMARSRISTPVRLPGVVTLGARTGDVDAASTQSTVDVPLPGALSALVHVGDRIPISDFETGASAGTGVVADLHETSTSGAMLTVAVVKLAAALPQGELVAGVLSPTVDSARHAMGRMPVAVIPQAALMGSPLRAFVFVQRDSTSFSQRRVVIESAPPTDAGIAIVWDGVRGGERVVVRGVDSLLAVFSRAVLTDEDRHTPRSRPP